VIALAKRKRLTKSQQKVVVQYQPLMLKIVKEMTKAYPTLKRMDIVGVAQMALVKAVLNCRNKFAISALVETSVRNDLLTMLTRHRPLKRLSPDMTTLDENAEQDMNVRIVEEVFEQLTLTPEQRRILWKWAGNPHSSHSGPSAALAKEIDVPFSKLQYLLRRLRKAGREIKLQALKQVACDHL